LPGVFQPNEAIMPPARDKIMRFESVGRTHVGCRRKVNEDAMLSRPGLWVVADGMGGHMAGEVASALVVEMLGTFAAEGSRAARTAAAHAALQDANNRLLEMAADTGTERTIGSTVVMMAADEKSFSCLWAGDSRAYLARDGVLSQMTRDHSLVQQLVDSGDLDPSATTHHPNANIITRAVGAAADLVVDSVDGEVRDGDVFLLASDGLTRLLGDTEILQELEASDLEAAGDRLLTTCLDRQAPDNVTFIIVRAS
jgi:serine/threonine-protein phosphatase Stp1